MTKWHKNIGKQVFGVQFVGINQFHDFGCHLQSNSGQSETAIPVDTGQLPKYGAAYVTALCFCIAIYTKR